METHYLHVLKIKLFAAWDLACPYVSKLFLSASRLIETWLFWELIGFIAMETNSISSLCQSCYLWFTESTSKLLFKKNQKNKTLLYLLFQSHCPLPFVTLLSPTPFAGKKNWNISHAMPGYWFPCWWEVRGFTLMAQTIKAGSPANKSTSSRDKNPHKENQPHTAILSSLGEWAKMLTDDLKCWTTLFQSLDQ